MSIQRGDTFRLLENGRVSEPSHLFVVLLITEGVALFSNLTDIANEDEAPCVINAEDDPRLITKPSTFRYKCFHEQPAKDIEAAINANKLLHCGQLANAALSKIIAGAKKSRRIKPKYRAMLQNAESQQARPTAALTPPAP